MIKKPNFPKIDKAYFKISIYVFFVAAALILFEKIVGNLTNISGSLGTASVYLKSLGAPFFLGFAFAYIMNPFMNFFERFLTMDFVFFRQHHKLTRMLCILTNYIIIIGGFIWILIYLLPELKASIVSLTSQLPAYTVDSNQRVQIFFDEIDFIESETVQKYINTIMDPIADASEDFPKTLETIVGNLYFFGRATVNLTFNLVMAVFIAFYMLYDKESFARQFRKIVYALSSRKAAEQFLRTMNRIHHIFQDFIVGKAVDSLIIGILAFVGFSMLKAPFPLVLSLIIGVTNMIPYFGPFIGAIPAAVITLLADPILAIWVILFILILQQFDGNYLGPKILGNSLDLSPLWIILAVVVGGALLGPVGMFIGVPILATFKTFGSEFISRKYQKKYPEDDPAAVPSPFLDENAPKKETDAE